MNFGQVTWRTLASTKRPYLSRFSATMTHPQHQLLISVFRSKPHHGAVSSTSLFLQKNSIFLQSQRTLRFYNNSNGGWQPMWITDSREKPVESVWSLVGIETKGSIRCPIAVVIKQIRNSSKGIVRKNVSFIFLSIVKKRYATERCPCIAGASFYCLFNSLTRSIILKSCEQITVLPLISGRAKLLKIIL